MITLLHFFDFEAGLSAGVAAGALVAGLWQGVALAVGTGLILRLVPKTTAAVRFLVWVAVFVVSATMPVVHLLGGAGAVTNTGSARPVQVDARWSYLLVGLWFVAGGVRLAMLLVEGVGLRTLWKSAVPVAGVEFEELTAKRRVQVCTSTEVDRPSVIGFLAPRILIPAWLYEQLSEVERRHIVLHEMEHLRRGDDWVNLLQKIGLVLFPLNPALFWIDRKLAAEREIACDDGVLRRTRTPRAYAASLTSIAERGLGMRLNRRMVALALGAIGAGSVFRRKSEFGRRIEGILGRRPAVSPTLAGGVAAVLMMGVLGATAGMMRVPELISFSGGERTQVATNLKGMRDDLHEPIRALNAMPGVEFENASFRVKKVPQIHPAKVTAKRASSGVVSASAASEVDSRARAVTVKSAQSAKRPGHLMVLTTWEQPAGGPSDGDEVPVSRVVVKMPDGRFYVAPYAAVPTQAGWLIVQL